MSKGEVRMEGPVDLYTWAKVEHVAREQGRDVHEVAVELLEREADKELAKWGPPTGVVVRGEGAVVVVGSGNRVTV